jgi:hypothetical protein
MAEDSAVVHTKSFTAGDSTEAAQAIASCIVAAGVDGYWELDDAITPVPGQVALRPTAQGFDSDSQRIGIRAQASGVLQFGYAPEGWGAITSFAELDATPPAVWSGWRNITGTATGMGASIVRVWVAQYRDQLGPDAPNPASSIAVIAGTASTWNHGAHVGRVIATDNASDPTNEIYGDAVLVGTPLSDTGLVNGWLRGSQQNNPDNASVIRTGETWWSFTRVAEPLAAASLLDAGGSYRVVPYSLHGFGKALPAPASNTIHAGRIGHSKYIRRHKNTLVFGAFLQSSTSTEQRWQSVLPSTAETDQVILWSLPVEVP